MPNPPPGEPEQMDLFEARAVRVWSESSDTTSSDMAKTTVVNLHDAPDFGQSPKDVYVGRLMRFGRFTKAKLGEQGGYFGNPCKGDEAVEDFATLFKKRIAEDAEYRKRIQALKGKTLGCWCKPNDCHADVIAAYLNKL